MGQKLIKQNAALNRATYTLPNKHYIPVDMKYIGIDNTSPFQSLLLFSENVKELT
jgi:urate oxidase